MKISEVKNKLEKLSIRPLKSLGQNFLIDEDIIKKIIQSENIKNYKEVIEIGPGLGSLTKSLIPKAKVLKLIELDKTLADYWKNQGVEVYHLDALKFDWSKISTNTLLISNLPYQISSRILVELFCLDSKNELAAAVLMFQKEVGDRIQAEPDDKKEYGLISILCQLRWNIELVTRVSKSSFYPAPDVESLVLKFKPNNKIKETAFNHKDFVNHLKTLFSARRKKISSSLKKMPGDLDLVKKYIELRPDHLTPEEHLDLYMSFKSYGKK